MTNKKSSLATDYYIINEFNALIASNLLMSRQDQERSKSALDVDFFEEVNLSSASNSIGTSWVVEPENDLFSAIRFYSKFKFTETEYQIANLSYAIVANKLNEYQDMVIDSNSEFDFDIRNKKTMLLNNWFSISISDIRKNLGGSYKREEIKKALYKLMSIQMEIKYREKTEAKDNVFVSGILSSSMKLSDNKIDFQVSGFQQLLFKEAFRNDMFYKVDDSIRQYHSKNFDYRGLNGLKPTQKQIIFYLAERFEVMHKLRKDKSIVLSFSDKQIVECRNFDIYSWLENEYKYNESKIKPEHNNTESKLQIKNDLIRKHKALIYKVRKDFKKNIKLLADHESWNKFFRLAKDKKSVTVVDFTRITNKVKFNPCKKIESQTIF